MVTQAIGGYNVVYTQLHYGLRRSRGYVRVQPGEKSYNEPACWFPILIFHFPKNSLLRSHWPTVRLLDCSISIAAGQQCATQASAIFLTY